MLLALLISTLTLTLPTTDVEGNLLPPEPLVAVIYQEGVGAVAAELGWPGEIISQIVPTEYGCWWATAWTIPTKLESANSETVCKIKPPTCYSCHQ